MQRYNVQHRNMKRYNVQHCNMKRYTVQLCNMKRCTVPHCNRTLQHATLQHETLNVPPRAVQRRRGRLSTDDNVHRDEATAARMQMCQECVSRVRPGADMGARWLAGLPRCAS